MDDELITVEEFVMQKCLIIDVDEAHDDDLDEDNEEDHLDDIHEMSNTDDDDDMETFSLKRKGSTSTPRSQTKKKTKLSRSFSKISDTKSSPIVLKLQPHLHNFHRLNYHQAIFGGGWDGWHCEGSVVRYLFGLLMWEVFFMPVYNELTGANIHVFLTPYQDSPIDFPYPSFFHNRYERLSLIHHPY